MYVRVYLAYAWVHEALAKPASKQALARSFFARIILKDINHLPRTSFLALDWQQKRRHNYISNALSPSFLQRTVKMREKSPAAAKLFCN